jgi:tetratricopeptide (TPR) repeat protein
MRHLGLIIGVNQYQDSTFRALRFAENDARALAQWLVNAKGGKWSPPDVQLAQGPHVTREVVESLLTQVCITSAEPDDVVLLYFAGHAFVDEKSGEGYLALTNTHYQNASNSGLSLRILLQQFMARSRAAQVLCVLDCYQSGQVWNMRRTSPYDSKPLLGQNTLNILQQMQNRLFLSSCRGNSATLESGESQLGAFTHNLILGLCGPARESATGNITLPKLHAFLFNKLAEQHRPQLFGQQNPPLILVGEPIQATQQQAGPTTPESNPVVPPSVSRPGGPTQGSGLLKMQRMAQQGAGVSTQTPPASNGPTTSGFIRSEALEEHRLQQCQQIVAQAQQLLQSQNYGPAFDMIEQALQIIPTDREALTLKAQLLGTAGRFPEALTIVEQIQQREPENPLIWSMRAVVLSNMGQHQQAISAIERSLELDAQNPETYGIRTTIMANMAAEQAQQPGGSGMPGTQGGNPTFTPRAFEEQAPVRENGRSFLMGTGLHLAGLIGGVVGCILLFVSQLPAPVGLVLASFGLALLCINATRGTFRYGISRITQPLIVGVLLIAALGGGYVLAFGRIMNAILISPEKRLLPALFTLVWLIAAASLPFLLAFGGLVGRMFKGSKRG